MGLVWTTTCMRLKSTRYKDLRGRLPCLEAPNLPPPLKGFIHLLVRVRSTPVVDPREGLCGCPLHHHRVASETPNPKFRHRRNFVARNRFPVYTAAVSFFLISRNFPRCCCRYRTNSKQLELNLTAMAIGLLHHLPCPGSSGRSQTAALL